jgi:predicted nucleic acid-binding protein
VALILDTNALSAATDCDPGALAVVALAESLAVPVIVLGEYRLRIAQSRHQAEYENWLAKWIASVTVLDVEEETSEHYAAIGQELKMAGTPIPTNDPWIAALCRRHDMPLASRDRHFDCVRGIERVDW